MEFLYSTTNQSRGGPCLILKILYSFVPDSNGNYSVNVHTYIHILHYIKLIIYGYIQLK